MGSTFTAPDSQTRKSLKPLDLSVFLSHDAKRATTIAIPSTSKRQKILPKDLEDSLATWQPAALDTDIPELYDRIDNWTVLTGDYEDGDDDEETEPAELAADGKRKRKAHPNSVCSHNIHC